VLVFFLGALFTRPVSRSRPSPKEAELVPMRSLLKLLVLALTEFVPNQARLKQGALIGVIEVTHAEILR